MTTDIYFVEPGVQQDVCTLETFSARCPESHVIVTHHALYGRMRSGGRCVPEGQGNTGCRADVMAFLDGKCSGKQTCKFSAADTELTVLNVCPRGYYPYLDVSYGCIPGNDCLLNAYV